MKRFTCLFFSLFIMAALMTGCGSGDKEEPKETPTVQEEPKSELLLSDGFWLAEKMVMEGNEFSKEDMEAIFGTSDTIMSLGFDEEGKVNGVLFGDFLSGTCTGELKAFTIMFDTEEVKGTYSEENGMELTLKDGSKIIMKNQSEMPKALAENPWITYDPDFTVEETCAMSNFMMYGRYLVEDNVVYGLTHSAGTKGLLGATAFTMVGDFPNFEETKILDNNGDATYLNKDGDTLYYILNGNQICSIGIDGSNRTVLYEGACDYMQIHEGKLYFADENYHFVSMDMDGENLTTVVDKEIYYPYFIEKDWMVFQDDADDESLHLYNTNYGTELNITYIPCYCPIMDGKYLYYVDAAAEEKYLARIDMSNPDVFYCEVSENTLTSSEFMIDDEWIYTSNNQSVEKENWKNLSGKGTELTEMEMYVSKDYNIYQKYDAQGLIIDKTLLSQETSGGKSFK